MTLGKPELDVIKWISAHSALDTKSSVIRELLKEAKRRGIKYNATTQDVELVLGDPDHIDRYYQSLKK